MSITETISAILTHLSIQREEVLRIIEQEDFPCVFARKAASTHKLFWLFLDSKENSQGFIEGLIDYTNFIQITPVNERLLQALVVVIETNKHHLFEQQQFAWSLIQTLIDNDPAPWPLRQRP